MNVIHNSIPGRKVMCFVSLALSTSCTPSLHAFPVASTSRLLRVRSNPIRSLHSRRIHNVRPWMNRVSMYSSTSTENNIPVKKNRQTTLEQQMTKDALTITNAAIKAVNPFQAVSTHLSYSSETNTLTIQNRSNINEVISYNLHDFSKIYIASFGKAASAMALATAEIVSPSKLPIQGIVITKDDHATQDQMDKLSSFGIHLYFASHPVPDNRSVEYSNRLMTQLKEEATEQTLVISCISGGGSSLFCTPKAPLQLDHVAKLNQSLLDCGMSITKMNVLRKRVEVGKGGGLVQAASPATCLTMVLSDVIGDPLDMIASGPTLKDRSTWAEARKLVEEYDLGKGGKYELPEEILTLIENGRDEEEIDSNDSINSFTKSNTILVGNNLLAVSAAAEEAKRLGYNPVILGCTIQGEAEHIANMYVSMAEQVQLQTQNSAAATFPLAKLPAALIAGGETVVTLPEKHGKGGRNQEIGLVAALRLQSLELRNIVLASVGTDGTDGPTDAAGAVIDGGTISRIEEENEKTILGDDALRNHDAYTFFSSAKESNFSLIKTGATGTNVADVCVVLVQ